MTRHSPGGASVAAQATVRGAGLGNELVPWAKAFIAARVLGLHLPPPAWLFNSYGLGDAFDWTRRSMARSWVRSVSPSRVEVTEEMYRGTGQHDYGDAVRTLARERGWMQRRNLTLIHRGMWGGYLAVRSARLFLRGKLLSAPGAAMAVSRWIDSGPPRINVVFHVRVGDFASEPPRAGQFNRSLPLSWYTSVAEALTQQLPDGSWQGWVVSDSDEERLQPLLAHKHVRFAASGRPRAIGAVDDFVLAMLADLLVCSVSSFSLGAAFLSDAPYLWFRPQLTPVGEYLSLWGHEEAQRAAGSPTRRNEQRLRGADIGGRGVPIGEGEPLSALLVEALLEGTRTERLETDLLYYGLTR